MKARTKWKLRIQWINLKVILLNLPLKVRCLLKRLGKLFVCCLLSVALIFGYSYKSPAHAAATGTVIAVSAASAIIAALAALGIAVSGNMNDADYKNFISKMQDEKTVKDNLAKVTATMVGTQLVYNVSKPFLQAIANRFTTVHSAMSVGLSTIPNKTLHKSGVWNSEKDMLSDAFGTKLSGLVGTVHPAGQMLEYSVLQPLFCNEVYSSPWAELTCKYSCAYVGYDDAWNVHAYHYLEYDISHINAPYDKYIQKENMADSSNPNFLGYVVQNKWRSADDNRIYMSWDLVSYPSANPCVTTLGWQYWDNKAAIPDAPGHDLVGSSDIYADGKSILNNPASDVIGAIGAAVGAADGTIPLNIPADADTDFTDARDVTQDSVLGKDITTDEDRDKDDDTNKDKDKTPPKPKDLPDLTLPEVVFKTKFPFCLPWDLYHSFQSLAVPAQPPKWDVPVQVKSINYSDKVTLDFSQFSTVAAICRWGIGVAFVIWLILLTRKIIGQ